MFKMIVNYEHLMSVDEIVYCLFFYFSEIMLGTSTGMVTMAGILCLFSVFTVFYITKMSSKNDKNLSKV